MSSITNRREVDVKKLMMSNHHLELLNDGINKFNVEFHGPKESLYEGGVWKVRVELHEAYPNKSPSVRFLNRIFHPNIEEILGYVCLDVLDKSWNPMFDLVTVFEEFLPQFLLFPDPSDPINSDAGSLLMEDQKQYQQKVKEWCELYAKREDINFVLWEDSEDEESDDGNNGEK